MLKNLSLLKEDMVKKNWTICSFVFLYKGVEYIVLVKRFVGKEKRISEYALVKLHFMKRLNLKDELEVEANAKGLLVEARVLRSYFGIEYAENLGDILKQFTAQLGKNIPIEISNVISEVEKQAMNISLSRSDSEDPEKIYCIGIKRNPSGKYRSDFNADKTRLFRPNLFTYFENDKTISFLYSKEQIKEKSDADILSDFSNSRKHPI